MHDLFRKIATDLNKSFIGKEQLILIEGLSRRSNDVLFGRNESNQKVLVAKKEIEDRTDLDYRAFKIGDYIVAEIKDATSQSLHGIPLYITNLDDYYNSKQDKAKFEVLQM